MSERFKNFLQWPVWVKIAILVSLFWCFGWYIGIDSKRIFDKTAFLLSLIPVILYWGFMWMFYKSIKRLHIVLFSVVVLSGISYFVFIAIDDYLREKAIKAEAAENYSLADCDKLILHYVPPKDPPPQPNAKDLFSKLGIAIPTQADRDYDWCIEQKKKMK